MCSLSLRDFMARSGRAYAVGYRRPLRGPTGADRCGRGDSSPGGRGARAGPRGAGGGLSPPRGGTRGPAPARRPCPAAAAIGVRAGVAGVVPSWEGAPGCDVLGPRTARGEGRAVAAPPAGSTAPPAGPPLPPAPALSQLSGVFGTHGRRTPRPILQPGTRDPWRRVSASAPRARPRPRLQANAPRGARPGTPRPAPRSHPTRPYAPFLRGAVPARPRRRGSAVALAPAHLWVDPGRRTAGGRGQGNPEGASAPVLPAVWDFALRGSD